MEPTQAASDLMDYALMRDRVNDLLESNREQAETIEILRAHIASLELSLEQVKGFFAGAVEYAEKMRDKADEYKSLYEIVDQVAHDNVIRADKLEDELSQQGTILPATLQPPHRRYAITITDTTTPAEAGAMLAAFVEGNIPVVDEITPRPDAELGHVFDWPFKE